MFHSRSLKSFLYVGLLLLGWQFTASADDATSVSGSYKANGKEGKINHVSARRQKEEGKDYIVLVFSDKDHSKEKKPDFKAAFGDLGDALVLTISADGRVAGCVVAHSGLKRMGLNSLGEVKITDFKLADGKIQGTVTTGGEVKAFDETWQADLKFSAKLP